MTAALILISVLAILLLIGLGTEFVRSQEQIRQLKEEHDAEIARIDAAIEAAAKRKADAVKQASDAKFEPGDVEAFLKRSEDEK
jgi:hypothetical protein